MPVGFCLNTPTLSNITCRLTEGQTDDPGLGQSSVQEAVDSVADYVRKSGFTSVGKFGNFRCL